MCAVALIAVMPPPEAAAPRPRREGLVLRVIVAEERLQKHVVEGSTICAEEFWPL